jgi:drug/metabolite transporter (DMT)-like permease
MTAAPGALPAEHGEAGPGQAQDAAAARRFPPVVELALASLALVVIGGIVMASSLPKRPPLTGPVVIAVVSGLLLAVAVVLLARLRDFAWDRFWLVFRWALLAYVVSAGMIAFAFIRDHTRGTPLAVALVMLAMFALDVPVMIAFTVARYSSPPHGR